MTPYSDLIARYSKPVPRYTSYPTAPHFHAGIDNETYQAWLSEIPEGSELSLYLHIPFCDRLCWFCGCHTKQIARYNPVSTYLDALYNEIRAVAAAVSGRGKVRAIHLGGGSPSLLKPDDMRWLDTVLRSTFDVLPSVDYSIELDPSDMTDDQFDALAEIGINRISLGVQDFDPRVQQAINRIQTFEQTAHIIQAMRERGVGSVNLDVLYGLPFQTLATIASTVQQALALEPDRLAIFGYAHVPWIKTHQKMIDEAALPGVHARFEQARAAAEQIAAAGYEPIGIDHFAKPGDSLAQVTRSGHLRRNFQGYTADQSGILIGLGASAIGQLPQGYVQNTVATGEYSRGVNRRGFSIAKGIALSDDDRMRAHVIERLMCDFAVSIPDLRKRFGTKAGEVIREMHLCQKHDRDGFVDIDVDTFRVTPAGRPFVRTIAASFDAYLASNAARYSIAV